MDKKKIMILGASLCQMPIIRLTQEMGFKAIVVSVAGNYPGFQVADKFYEIDVRDREQILNVARENNISGILTDQTDLPVPTVAYVAEQLSLPGIGLDCALRFTNKYVMRQYCEKIGVPVPKHIQVASFNDAVAHIQDLQFPLVLKPVDSQGSRGVVKVADLDELESAFQNALVYSAVQQVILEEYFEGREIVIEGFMTDDGFTNLVVGDREYFDLSNIFIPRQTIFPSLIDQQVQKNLLDLNTKLIKGFAPAFGITHSEFLVNESTGEIRLVETAIRGGGVFISSDLIPLASNIDANRLLIEHAAGVKRSSADIEHKDQRAAAYLCFYLPEGQIKTICGVQEVQELKGVHKVFLDDLNVGKMIAPMIDKTMRQGPILIEAKNRQDLQEIMETVGNTLRIEVETPTGLQSMVW